MANIDKISTSIHEACCRQCNLNEIEFHRVLAIFSNKQASKCDVGNWIFSKSQNILRNCLDFFWEEFFGGIVWEKLFGRIFLGGTFWEKCFGRIFLGGILWEVILSLHC